MHKTTPNDGQALFLKSSALEKISEPEDIASVIFFLISDMSKSITCASISAHGGARL
jgi:enoyl-[acyl-carrier-protein] reductase (NADH)